MSSRRKPDRGLLPPVPPATALGVVLSEAGGCGRGARPEMRAVGGAGIVIPAEARQGAAAPRAPRNGLRPGTAVPGGALAGGRIRRPPDPLAGAGGTRNRLVRGWRVWPRGAAGDEGAGWRPEDAFRSEADRGARPPYDPPRKLQGLGGSSSGGGVAVFAYVVRRLTDGRLVWENSGRGLRGRAPEQRGMSGFRHPMRSSK